MRLNLVCKGVGFSPKLRRSSTDMRMSLEMKLCSCVCPGGVCQFNRESVGVEGGDVSGSPEQSTGRDPTVVQPHDYCLYFSR